MARRTLVITYIATYLLAVGTIIRYFVGFQDHRFWFIALFTGYLVVSLSELFIVNRNGLFTYIHLLVQTAIICTLSLIGPNVDFWAALFLPLVLYAMRNLPQPTGFGVTGVFAVIMAILMILGPGPQVGLPLILINGVVYFFLAFFLAVIREAETSNKELRKQQLELQAAHRQLQTCTAQAEELAVLQERNRLARDLHDSVTQYLCAVTLYADAVGRLLSSGQIDSIAENVYKLRRAAQNALGEMRLLIYELRPPILEQEGLVTAIETRLKAVESRAGLKVQLNVERPMILPPDVESGLYRIAQETLNNILKHSHARTITVSLRLLEAKSVMLEITDDGIGFDPGTAQERGGMGLRSIAERVEQLAGRLKIESAPGAGTTLQVRVEVEQ
jgi:signal transduction histidine kinase